MFSSVSLKKSMTIAGIGLRKLSGNPRLSLLIWIMVLVVFEAVNPIKEFCVQVGYRVTPWVFPVLMRHHYFGVVLLLGLVLLFCDAPFMDAGQTLVMIRSGKKNWCLGQLLYIAICAGLYFLAIFAVQCVVLVPHLTFHASWGKVITTLALMGQKAGALTFSEAAIRQFDGFTATLLCFSTLWLASIMLGAVMFMLNLRYRRAVGAIVGTAIVLMQSFTLFTASKIVFYLSPFTFIQPRFYTGASYIAGVYGVLFVLLMVMAYLSVRAVSTRDIHTLPEI